MRVKWQKHKASSQCRKRVAVSRRNILEEKRGRKKKEKGKLVQKRAMVSDSLKQMYIVESVFENHREDTASTKTSKQLERSVAKSTCRGFQDNLGKTGVIETQ